jgi:glycosyltransferase involved in cell wall biosynthesis
MKVDLCLPVYNEAKILEANAKKLLEYCLVAGFSFDWRVVLVINGSSDESLVIAKKIKTELPGLVEVVEIKEKGRGYAIKKYWLESSADVVAYMDADLAVSLTQIKKLIGAVADEGFDLAIGSRLLPESKIDRGFGRELVSQSYIYLSRLILNHRFSDLQCGFKAIKKESFLIVAPYIKGRNWFFDTELIVFSKVSGLKIKEVPVEWEENRYDQRQSKVNILRDSFVFLLEILKLRLRMIGIKGQNKQKNQR